MPRWGRRGDARSLGGQLSRWQILLAKALFNGRERLDFYDIFATYLDRSVRQPEALAEIRAIEIEGRLPILYWTRPLTTAIPHWLFRILDHGENFGAVMAAWLPHDEAMIFAAMAEAGLTGQRLARFGQTVGAADGLEKFAATCAYSAVGRSACSSPDFGTCRAAFSRLCFPRCPRAWHLKVAAATLKATSDFFARFGPYLLASITLLPLGVARLLPRWKGSLRKVVDDCRFSVCTRDGRVWVSFCR